MLVLSKHLLGPGCVIDKIIREFQPKRRNLVANLHRRLFKPRMALAHPSTRPKRSENQNARRDLSVALSENLPLANLRQSRTEIAIKRFTSFVACACARATTKKPVCVLAAINTANKHSTIQTGSIEAMNDVHCKMDLCFLPIVVLLAAVGYCMWLCIVFKPVDRHSSIIHFQWFPNLRRMQTATATLAPTEMHLLNVSSPQIDSDRQPKWIIDCKRSRHDGLLIKQCSPATSESNEQNRRNDAISIDSRRFVNGQWFRLTNEMRRVCFSYRNIFTAGRTGCDRSIGTHSIPDWRLSKCESITWYAWCGSDTYLECYP